MACPRAPRPLPPNAYRLGHPVDADRFLVNVRRCHRTGRDITLAYQVFGPPLPPATRADRDTCGGGGGPSPRTGVPCATGSAIGQHQQQRGRRRPVVLLLGGLGSSCYTWRTPLCELLVRGQPSQQLAPPPPPPAQERDVSEDSTAASVFVSRRSSDVTRQLTEETIGDAQQQQKHRHHGGDDSRIGRCDDSADDIADGEYTVIRMDNRDMGLSTHLDGLPTLRSQRAQLAVTLAPRWWWRFCAGLRRRLSRLWGGGRRGGAQATPTTATTTAAAAGVLRVLFGDPPYTVEDMAEDALALLDGLGVDDVHLVGCSMGGLIAQSLALRAPARVRSLTLIYTHSGVPLPQGAAAQRPPVAAQSAKDNSSGSGSNARGGSVFMAGSACVGWVSRAVAAAAAVFIGCGWSWEVVGALLQSSKPPATTAAAVEGGGRSGGGGGGAAAPATTPVDTSLAQRAAYAAHFHGGYVPDAAAYRAVKRVDLTRAPFDRDGAMRQLWATQHCLSLEGRIAAVFGGAAAAATPHSTPHSGKTKEKGTSSGGSEEDGLKRRPSRRMPVLILQGMLDNTIAWPNALRLAELYETARSRSRVVMYPRMGHTIPAELFCDVAAEVRRTIES